LFQASEILFASLATLHNIQYFLDIMRQIRQAILLSHFPEWLRRFQTNESAGHEA
jgi:tRNA-guanine family transglycosylase